MEFKLPELGEGVHEGELVRWRVQKGDSVKYDQPLCEIMTDKATVEIPSAFQGKVAELHAQEGQVVHVGQLMLRFEGPQVKSASAATVTESYGSSSSSAPSASKQKGSAHESAPSKDRPTDTHALGRDRESGVQPPLQSASSHAGSGTGSSAGSSVFAAPSARRLARELGIDLGEVSGTGKHGRIMKDDVLGMRQTGATSAGAAQVGGLGVRTSVGSTLEERIPLKGLRKKIAEKMRLSKDHAAHFTYVEEADATELVRLRHQAKEMGAKEKIKVTYLPFVMKAMVAALRKYPILNSSLDEEKGELVFKHYYNIGLSIQTDEGLTAPVVKDVEHKSVFQLAKEIEDLVDRARAKRLTLEDFQNGTITLTNAGSIGGLFATPVINYPEVAILGFNKIFRKPVVKKIDGKEQILIRDWTYFSISLDHRVVDGAVGAEFMKDFINIIENPSLLILS